MTTAASTEQQANIPYIPTRDQVIFATELLANRLQAIRYQDQVSRERVPDGSSRIPRTMR